MPRVTTLQAQGAKMTDREQIQQLGEDLARVRRMHRQRLRDLDTEYNRRLKAEALVEHLSGELASLARELSRLVIEAKRAQEQASTDTE